MAKKDFSAMEARGASGNSAAHEALRSRVGNPTSVRLDEVQPNPRNPRYPDDDPEVVELAETLTKVGQLQPAVVVSREQYLTFYPASVDDLGEQRWVVAVGNRRLAASRLARRKGLDVRVATDVETVDDFEDMVLIENIQRKALPPLLEAEQLQRRLSRPGESTRTVGEAIGKSHAYVQQRVDLLRMIPEFQALLRQGELNVKTARWIGTRPDDAQRALLIGGPPYGPEKSASSGNPVSTNAAANRSNGGGSDNAKARHEDLAGSPSPTVQPAERDGEPDPASGNPVSAPANEADARGQHVKQPAAGAAESATAPVDQASEGEEDGTSWTADLEKTRTSVGQLLDTALSELDSALPAGGDGHIGAALADAQRLLVEARSALRREAVAVAV